MDPIDRVAELEVELLQPAVRAGRDRLERLLHADFAEIGASGRRWSRAELIDALVDEAPGEDVVVSDLAAQVIADGVILVTTTTRRGERVAHRSSIWVRVDGRWVVRFHQGTITTG